MIFVNKVTASKVVDPPTLTLLALLHNCSGFFCALCVALALSEKYIVESRFGFGLLWYMSRGSLPVPAPVIGTR
jgi:hypothetical protein